MPPEPAPAIVLGTHNAKKGIELAELLSGRFRILTLADFPPSAPVEETGATFAENARLKASAYATRLGMWTIGEDSGLCVDALNGAPGVFSARFSGDSASDEANNALLLERLSGVSQSKRTAHYVCHVALASPTGEISVEAEEACQGRILTAPRGSHGFGYDPLFEIAEYHRTFAELGAVAKLFLSHRSRAVRRMAFAVERAIARGAK